MTAFGEVITTIAIVSLSTIAIVTVLAIFVFVAHYIEQSKRKKE